MKEIDPAKTREFFVHSRQALSTDQACGCFFCLRIFGVNEIVWQDDDDTAMCPHCGIDAVIGASSGLPITKQFLKSMREYWFTEGE